VSNKSKRYDWAQAIFSLATNEADDLNELAAIADLDPQAGDLSDVDLSELDLSGQNLSGWDLSNAKLQDTILRGTELRGAKVDPWELVTARDWESANLDDSLRMIAQRLNADLRRDIRILELSTRTHNCLWAENIRLIGELVQKSEAELLRTPYFGRKSLNEVTEALAQIGLHLGMEVPGWRHTWTSQAQTPMHRR
jgi:hypothetical protein